MYIEYTISDSTDREWRSVRRENHATRSIESKFDLSGIVAENGENTMTMGKRVHVHVPVSSIVCTNYTCYELITGVIDAVPFYEYRIVRKYGTS